jgi:hypothetical protein
LVQTATHHTTASLAARRGHRERDGEAQKRVRNVLAGPVWSDPVSVCLSMLQQVDLTYCALFSQSHRIPRTYSPGSRLAGTTRSSEINVLNGSRPEHLPVSLRVRSTVSGQGGSKLCICQEQASPLVCRRETRAFLKAISSESVAGGTVRETPSMAMAAASICSISTAIAQQTMAT